MIQNLKNFEISNGIVGVIELNRDVLFNIFHESELMNLELVRKILLLSTEAFKLTTFKSDLSWSTVYVAGDQDSICAQAAVYFNQYWNLLLKDYEKKSMSYFPKKEQKVIKAHNCSGQEQRLSEHDSNKIKGGYRGREREVIHASVFDHWVPYRIALEAVSRSLVAIDRRAKRPGLIIWEHAFNLQKKWMVGLGQLQFLSEGGDIATKVEKPEPWVRFFEIDSPVPRKPKYLQRDVRRFVLTGGRTTEEIMLEKVPEEELREEREKYERECKDREEREELEEKDEERR